jgi:hypothetical protein
MDGISQTSDGSQKGLFCHHHHTHNRFLPLLTKVNHTSAVNKTPSSSPLSTASTKLDASMDLLGDDEYAQTAFTDDGAQARSILGFR